MTVNNSLDNEKYKVHRDIILSEISISTLSEVSTNFNITNDNTDSQYGLYVDMTCRLHDIKR